MVKAVMPEGNEEGDGKGGEEEEAWGLLMTERTTTTLDLAQGVKEGDGKVGGSC